MRFVVRKRSSELDMKELRTPLKQTDIDSLKAGDSVSLSGVIYTARDQVHLRISEMLDTGRINELPGELKGQVIYYCGPTPGVGRPIGACGPTTSSRMDGFTPGMLGLGVKGLIGKGRRSDKVVEAIKKEKAVYFLAPAGAGAYLSERVEACEVAAFSDLGPEAIYRLTVKAFPLVVGIDASGGDIYDKLK